MLKSVTAGDELYPHPLSWIAYCHAAIKVDALVTRFQSQFQESSRQACPKSLNVAPAQADVCELSRHGCAVARYAKLHTSQTTMPGVAALLRLRRNEFVIAGLVSSTYCSGPGRRQRFAEDLRFRSIRDRCNVPDVFPRLQGPHPDVSVLFASRRSHPHDAKFGSLAFVGDLKDLARPLQTFDTIHSRPMEARISCVSRLYKGMSLAISSTHFYLEPNLGSRFLSALLQKHTRSVLSSSAAQCPLDPTYSL